MIKTAVGSSVQKRVVCLELSARVSLWNSADLLWFKLPDREPKRAKASSHQLRLATRSEVWLANAEQKISYEGYRFPPEVIRQIR